MTAPEKPGARRPRVLLVSAWVALLVLAAVQIILIRREPHHGDLLTYLAAARHLAVHPDQSVYAACPEYVYPPLLAILLRPLIDAPSSLLGAAWDIGRYAAVAVALCLTHGILARRLPSRAAILLTMVIGLACVRSAWHDGLRGNVNGFLIAGIVIGWWAFSDGRPAWAGLAWGLVAAIKPSSAIVLAVIVAAPRKPLAACWLSAAATLLITSFLIPALVIGPSNTMRQWVDYPRGLAQLPEVYWKYGNQSLGLSLARAAGRFQVAASLEPPLHLTVYRWIGNSSVVVWAAALLWRIRKRPAGERVDTMVAAGCILSTLLSPLVWYSHYLLLVPAYAALALRIARPSTMGRRILSGWAAVFAAILISTKATILGTVAWAPLALLLAFTLMARPIHATAPPESANPPC